jgi:hypothetical protein
MWLVVLAVFQVPALGITLDTRKLHGQPLNVNEFEGLAGYLRLLKYCLDQIDASVTAP